MEKALTDLKGRLQKINDLNAALAVLSWDQLTFMPPMGAAARGRQIALIGQMSQEVLIDPEFGRLLDTIETHLDDLDPEDETAALVRVTRRDFDQATRIPVSLLGRLLEHSADTYQLWTKAREEDDFSLVHDNLETTLALSRDLANCFPGYEHIADPLIDMSDHGMTVATIRPIFAELRAALIPLVERITSQPPADDSCLHQHYPQERQLTFARELARQFGYDFERGRLDLTHHPFMTKFSSGDVRMTTRVDEHDLADNLFSVLHETGHGLYELGINPRYEGGPLNKGASSGLHESQSRLWENLVGRSQPFWSYQFPHLQAAFPDQLGDVDVDTFYRAINKVSRSLIRTDADEVTYNLHIMIRFELELQLLEGTLAVADLPHAWQARYESDLGVQAPSDKDGCLQDVHWYEGTIGGAFQGYTLGNIMSAVFFDAARRAHPHIPEEIGRGRYETLHSWLRDNIYVFGSKFTTAEIIRRVTGGDLTIQPYITYLQEKFGRLYDLSGLGGPTAV